jgi:protein-S-isoprenylcysteine O-methyltransferase Ste14
MAPDRRRSLLTGRRGNQVFAVLVTAALIVAGSFLSDAPVWAAVVVAGAAAALLALRWWWDHRHGQRWF